LVIPKTLLLVSLKLFYSLTILNATVLKITGILYFCISSLLAHLLKNRKQKTQLQVGHNYISRDSCWTKILERRKRYITKQGSWTRHLLLFTNYSRDKTCRLL